MNYVLTLGARMQTYPVSDVLKVGYFMEHYDENLIKNYINSF